MISAAGRMVSVGKRFEVAIAHRLPNYAGKCRELHGHNLTIEVEVTGKVHPVDGSSDEGLVVDFAELKRVFKERVEGKLDHHFINETIDVPVTSSEMLAVWIYEQLAEVLPVNRVRVWETGSAYAEYWGE